MMRLFGAPRIDKMKAKKNVDGLIKALSYKRDYRVRRSAAEALAQIGDSRAITSLIVALQDKDGSVRWAALEALDALGWKPESGEAETNYWSVLLSEVGIVTRLVSSTHWSRILAHGDRAIHHILPLLDLPLIFERNDLTDNWPESQNNISIVTEAIRILGELGAGQAIPKLRGLTTSRWAEVSQASYAALAVLESKNSNELQLDQKNPYAQIGQLWTAIVQGHRNIYPPQIIQNYVDEAISKMPNLRFSSLNENAGAWGRVGGLLFKSQNPDWSGGEQGTKPCPEVKMCYEEALRCEPGSSWWKQWIQYFS